MRRPALLGLAALGLTGCRAEGPPPPDPEIVALGRQIYGQYCASCHGAEGEGQPNWEVPNELGELPAPPHDGTGHTWKHSDAMLYHIVLHGWRDPFNKSERLTMPAFQDTLTPREIRSVITYLKTLWTDQQQRFQWEESQGEPFPVDGEA